jgi:serine/threonine-protein kinase
MKLEPGRSVTPRVKLVRPLDQGGMGLVWVADHVTLGCEVAVKFIAGERPGKQHELRFAREAKLAARIKSPHVVRIFDHGLTDDGQPYIVMELLDGESLAARLERAGPLDPAAVELLVSQIAEALEQAHDLGIVHRDIKPSNLFLLRSGYELFAKVLDFGIAKQTDGDAARAITETGALVGTPLYMSPETLLSPRSADHRADLWALAVVAYHALTGRPAYEGETPAALAFAIEQRRLVPPSAHVDGLSPELDAWFKLALSWDLDARFATAPELARSFRSAAQGAPFSVATGGANLDATARNPSPQDSPEPSADDVEPLTPSGAALATTIRDDSGPDPSPGISEAGDGGGGDDEGIDSAEPDSETPTSPAAGAADPAEADAKTVTSARNAAVHSPSTFAGATAATRDAPSGRRGFRKRGAIVLGAVTMAVSLLGIRQMVDQPAESTDGGPSTATFSKGRAAPRAGRSAPTAATSDPIRQAEPPANDGVAASRPTDPEGLAESPSSTAATAAGPPPPFKPNAEPTTPTGPPRPQPAPAAADEDPCKDPFLRDEDGDLIPKLECLPGSKRR